MIDSIEPCRSSFIEFIEVMQAGLPAVERYLYNRAIDEMRKLASERQAIVLMENIGQVIAGNRDQ